MEDFQSYWQEKDTLFNNSPLIPDCLRMVICGPSNSGKTALLNRMLLSDGFLDYERLYIFTPTISQPIYQIIINGFKKIYLKNNLNNYMIVRRK